jgi:hypothetical protein
VTEVVRVDEVNDERGLKVENLRKERVARLVRTVQHDLRDEGFVREVGEQRGERCGLLVLRIVSGRWRRGNRRVDLDERLECGPGKGASLWGGGASEDTLHAINDRRAEKLNKVFDDNEGAAPGFHVVAAECVKEE